MKPAAWLFILLILGVESAFAHRMDMAYHAEGGELVMEAWVGEDDMAVNADAQIINAEGIVLAKGKTDQKGEFRWRPSKMQAVTLSIYAGLGHKKTIALSQEELTQLFSQTQTTPSTNNSSQPSSRTLSSPIYSTTQSFGTPERIIIGFTFLAAAMGAWLAYRNTQKLTALEKLMTKRFDPHEHQD